VIPVDQTNADLPVGNCLQACVASVFELPMDEVPHFLGEHGSEWFSALDRWLAQRFGLQALLLQMTDPPACTQPRGYCIASGPTRGCRHD
jgi:hypothetical protein